MVTTVSFLDGWTGMRVTGTLVLKIEQSNDISKILEDIITKDLMS